MSNCEYIVPGIGSQQTINKRFISINIQGKLKLLYHFIVNLFTLLSPRVDITLHNPSKYNLCFLTGIQRKSRESDVPVLKKFSNFFLRDSPFIKKLN